MDHHLGDTLFRRHDSPLVGQQSELALDRGLDAGPIEDFSLNFRSGQSFSTHDLNQELIVLVVVQILHRADDNARANEKLLFGMAIALDPT